MKRIRALLLIDGPSDEPLGRHVAAIARGHGVALDIVAPEFDRMDPPPGRAISARLTRILAIDPDFEMVVVHRDAENQGRDVRLAEIQAALADVQPALPHIPVIPLRMTEAWLLLDEAAIRSVAGRPSGTMALSLPVAAQVERDVDPKATLRQALRSASGHRGRRLRKFERDFSAHRRQLLDRLDRSGPLRELRAWQELESDVATILAAVRDVPSQPGAAASGTAGGTAEQDEAP